MALENVIPYLRNRLLSTILGTSIGYAASDAIRAPLRDVTYEFNRRFDNVPLAPADAAVASVRNAMAYEQALREAADAGMNADRFAALVNSTSRPLGLTDLLTLWRRRELTEAEVREALSFSDTKARYTAPLLKLKRILNSPDDLAQMAVQGVLEQDEAAQLAELSGIERPEFDRLYRLHGDPPGPQEAFALLNRNVIDDGEWERTYRQSRLKPEWMAAFKQLRFHLESPAELIRFLVREIFTPEIRQRYRQDEDYPEAATAQGHRLGISETLMRDYWAAHWELPATGQAFEMFHRRRPDSNERIIDRGELSTLLRAKDVMPYWRDKLVQIAYRVPGRIDIRRLLHAGIIDADEAEEGYKDLGYAPAHAHRLRLLAVALKQAPERDLAKAELTALYIARLIGADEARTRLGRLGYSEQETAAIIGLAEFSARNKFRAATIAVVRARYLAREVSREVAAERLDRIGVPAAGRDEALELWEFERSATPQRLTEPMARSAFLLTIITEPDYRAELARMGYPTREIDILVALAIRGRRAEREADLTRADVLRLYKGREFTRAEAETELANLGYDERERRLLLDAVTVEPEGPGP